MAGAGGGDERRAVGAFVEAESGGAEGTAQALSEAQGETFLFVVSVIEQRRQSGIDRGGLGVAGHRGEIDKLEVCGSVVLGEVALDRSEVGQLFRVLPFARVIDGRLGRFGPPFFDDFRITLHFQP